jgi:hypothetical protein
MTRCAISAAKDTRFDSLRQRDVLTLSNKFR